MSAPAHVTKVEELEHFRGGVVQATHAAADALLMVEMEVRRFVDWLRLEQPQRLKQQHLRSMEEVAQARAALLRKQLQKTDDRTPDVIEEKKALALAERRQRMIEEQMTKVKRWSRAIEEGVDDYLGQARPLAALLEGERPPIVDFLDRVLASVRGYLAVETPTSYAALPATSVAREGEDEKPKEELNEPA